MSALQALLTAAAPGNEGEADAEAALDPDPGGQHRNYSGRDYLTQIYAILPKAADPTDQDPARKPAVSR
jgi:hypothetical protein